MIGAQVNISILWRPLMNSVHFGRDLEWLLAGMLFKREVRELPVYAEQIWIRNT